MTNEWYIIDYYVLILIYIGKKMFIIISVDTVRAYRVVSFHIKEIIILLLSLSAFNEYLYSKMFFILYTCADNN